MQRFGLFLRLAGEGADGILPTASLGGEYFRHDARRHTLSGSATGRTFCLGDTLPVRLEAADPVSGGLVLALGEGR